MDKITKQKIIILSVTNDLVTDRRVDKVIQTLQKIGFQSILIGRKLKNSQKLNARKYKTIRINLFFTKGALFYAEYNIRLFILLIFKKSDLLLSNDLDTLLANYMAYIIKKYIFRQKVFLIYDSHEYFTEVPELNGRIFAKNTWLFIEKIILPKIKYAYTVCQSIADEYYKKYGIQMQVIRNLPVCMDKRIINIAYKEAISLKQSFKNRKIILYQGALNIGRGLEAAVLSMQYIENAILLIIGEGDIENRLKNIVNEYKLNNKVYFTGKIPLEKLNTFTKIADIGLVLQEDLSLSYRYVLPNRLFDFIHAEIPVLASNLPEIKKVLDKTNAGILIEGLKPKLIAEKINYLLSNQQVLNELKKNIQKVKNEYCWENEEIRLFEIFKKLIL
ncbi:MAG: glycosyltransferase [Bacteroidales bacterium]|nr:glycosyltransferase [Bacteroidales bacterium]